MQHYSGRDESARQAIQRSRPAVAGWVLLLPAFAEASSYARGFGVTRRHDKRFRNGDDIHHGDRTRCTQHPRERIKSSCMYIHVSLIAAMTEGCPATAGSLCLFLSGEHLKISLAFATFSLEDSLMTKRALSAVAGFLGLCFPLFAQQTYRPDLFSALNNSRLHLPSLSLSDGQLFSFSSAFTWMEPTPPDFLPALSTTAPPRANVAAAYPKDSSKEVVDVRKPNLFDYASGEVGFLYGRSTGKFGREVEQGYIMGEVGDDKFHITVGASYENSSGRFPRLGH